MCSRKATADAKFATRCIRVHYRAQLNFTWEGMEEARQSLARIDDWLRRLREKRGGERPTLNASVQRPTDEQFEEALDDDLNISAALGFLFESIRETNRALDQAKLTAAERRASRLDWWKRIDSVLALTRGGNGLAGGNCVAGRQRGCRRGLPRIGAKVMNCATNSQRSGWEARDSKDGQTVTRRGG